MFTGPFDESIVARAKQKGIIDIAYINFRSFAKDKYKSVDDHPYGGGLGMILRVDIVHAALTHAIKLHPRVKAHTVLLDPQGAPYSQKIARELATYDHLILLCGHYEGIDERIRSLIDEQISIGDYITSGGELPSMVLVDSIVRLLPGVLKNTLASLDESFSPGLEYPQYTRPEVYLGLKVPDVLKSGNHALVAKWKRKEARARTQKLRPDLIG